MILTVARLTAALANHDNTSVPADMDGQEQNEFVLGKRRRRNAATPRIGKSCANPEKNENWY